MSEQDRTTPVTISYSIDYKAGLPLPKKIWTEAIATEETAKMQVDTQAFFEKNGPWNRLTNAAKMLKEDVVRLYSPETASTKPHRNDLGDTYRDYLFGDLGLHGELTNPLATIVSFQLAPDATFATDPLANRLTAFCREFNEPSELSKAGADIAHKTNAIAVALGARGNEVPIVEPKKLALFRSATVIEQWLDHNKKHIAPEKRDAITKHLASYRDELAATLGFVNKATQFLEQQKRAGLSDNLNEGYGGR